jgi:ABC-type spermidine/putrescine transport system permease subunit I
MSTFSRRRIGTERGPGIGARGRAAASRGALGLARLVRLVSGAVAAVIVVGILLVVLEANGDNAIVDALLDAARFLAGPFDNVFDLARHKTQVAVNWGLAAAVYLLAGRFVARLLARI